MDILNWYENNRKKYLERKKRYREKHKDQIAEYYRKWYAKNGRKRTKRQLENIKKWQKEHKKQVRVAGNTNSYINRHNVKRPTKCENCRKERKVVAHHPDYNRPLNVVWLCYSCHKKLHNAETQQTTET